MLSHINKKRPNTRLQIIQLAAKLFIDEGFQNTSIAKLAKILDLSPGNITFYFKSKEQLLAVLVDEQINFQRLMMEKATNEGRSSLLTYCLELAVIASICEEDAAAENYYASAYTSALTLKLIRKKQRRCLVNIVPTGRRSSGQPQKISFPASNMRPL